MDADTLQCYWKFIQYAARNSSNIPSSMLKLWNLYQIQHNCNVLRWDYNCFTAMKYFSAAHSNTWGCFQTKIHNSLFARSKAGVLNVKFWNQLFPWCWKLYRHRGIKNYPYWFHIFIVRYGRDFFLFNNLNAHWGDLTCWYDRKFSDTWVMMRDFNKEKADPCKLCVKVMNYLSSVC